ESPDRLKERAIDRPVIEHTRMALSAEVMLFDNAGVGESSGKVPPTVAGMALALEFLGGLGQSYKNARFTALLGARFRQAALLTRWFERVEPPGQVREPPAKKAARTKKEPWRCAVQRPHRHKSQCQNDDHGQRDARDCIPSSGNDPNANGDEYCCHEK